MKKMFFITSLGFVCVVLLSACNGGKEDNRTEDNRTEDNEFSKKNFGGVIISCTCHVEAIILREDTTPKNLEDFRSQGLGETKAKALEEIRESCKERIMKKYNPEAVTNINIIDCRNESENIFENN